MNQSRPDDSQIEVQVARVADEYLDLLARGERPEPEEFADRYPELVDVLHEVLPALRMIHALAPTIDPRMRTLPVAENPMLGEFRLIREIGRGGMGVVYEAEQSSLGRRVALKVLPYVAAASRSLARFRVETQVASMLQHPHIVPVYAVGCDQGVHYYAMQRIVGQSLAEALRHRHGNGTVGPRGIDPRLAADLALQAAEALDYAHENGVLHRDVKPGNLLVDDRGHLWVTDFGLARAPGSADLTLTGDLLGTVRYMSPEQLSGNRPIDSRSDLHALGITLYELVTGRPAFDAVDRHELIRQVVEVEPPLPRRICPGIPRDLETIILHAIAKDPAHRYPTARALAEDLRRFLSDRPILAVRPGLLERANRWGRRRKALVATAALLLAIASVVSSAFAARLWAEQTKTRAALEVAQTARFREREALKFTFEASDQIASNAMQRLLRPDPVHGEEEYFCRRALAYYEKLANRYHGDEEMASIVAVAQHKIAFLRMILRDPEAEAAFRRSLALYDQLLMNVPGDYELAIARVDLLRDMTYFYQTSRRYPEAIACSRDRLKEQRRLVYGPDALRYLIFAEFGFVRLLYKESSIAEAEQALRQLSADLADLREQIPGDPLPLNNWAWLLLTVLHNPSPSDMREALECAESAVQIAPERWHFWNTLGVARYRSGLWNDAIAAFEQSMTRNAGGSPYDWLFLAMCHQRLGRPGAALQWFEKAKEWTPPDPDAALELSQFREEAAEILGLGRMTRG
ncbi:MAG: serine/threonine-protein kinase [Isosphaeraceae bacterium]